MDTREAYLKMFKDTMENGRLIKPRGSLIRELEDYQITVDPLSPFCGFAARQYNYDYFWKELRWKLTGNKYDESIKQHAKMWESVQNPDGTFNSNYGQYWFGEQQGVMQVIFELLRDPDSRRAVIPTLSKDHMTAATIDTVCTNCIGFRVRDNELNCTAHMRSSDQIFGLGTDLPTFAFVQLLIHGVLKSDARFCGLQVGTLTVHAMSSHIYERHFSMVQKILEEPQERYFKRKLWEFIDSADALRVIASRGDVNIMPPSIRNYF
jgi:thymidylate synthase